LAVDRGILRFLPGFVVRCGWILAFRGFASVCLVDSSGFGSPKCVFLDRKTWTSCGGSVLPYGSFAGSTLRTADLGTGAAVRGHWNWRTLQCHEPLRLATGLPQPQKIGLHVAVCLERLEGCVKNRDCSCIVRSFDSIVHPFAITSCFYDSGTTKIGEMP
jgi:hypothetical protein